MERLITKFSDGSILAYDKGGFDDWCVYLTVPTASKRAPRDVEYFTDLLALSQKYGNSVYDAFVLVFDLTTKQIEQEVLDEITRLSVKYGKDALKMEKTLTIIYAGMVAEENKAYSRLGKKVKRLGLHQVLKEGLDPRDAANFSKGKPWRTLLAEYEKRIP